MQRARSLRPRVVIVPPTAPAEQTADTLRTLEPAPTVLVGIDSWDLQHAVASIAYTGADGWVAYFDLNRLAEMLAAWRSGTLSPKDQTRFDALLPPPAPKSAAKKRRERAGAAYAAYLSAIDAQPLASLKKEPPTLVCSLGRRTDVFLRKAEDLDRALKSLPKPLRDQWLVWDLNACILFAGNGFQRFLERSEDRVKATLLALEAMGTRRHLALFRSALDAKSASAKRALDQKWRAQHAKWPEPFSFQMRHALANLDVLDRACRALVK